jgi:hypothetical protein
MHRLTAVVKDSSGAVMLQDMGMRLYHCPEPKALRIHDLEQIQVTGNE